MQDIEPRDRELLTALQSDLPIVSTPFAFIGQTIDMSEKEVLKRTERLKRDGAIRQLAFQFDLRGLGYRSCLVAARVPEERVDEAAAVINAHPGVTQNYLRNNSDYNLWFTIAVSPFSRLGLEKTIDILTAEADCASVHALPTLKLYKSTASDGVETSGEMELPQTNVTPAEAECVRILQTEIPLQPRPFDVMTRGTSLTPEEVLTTARELQKRGQLRGFSAVGPRRKPNFGTTAMGVWIVPAERAEETGLRLARHRNVSHCYRRPVFDDWPYSIYTTVHGRTVDECESVLLDLSIDSGIEQRQALFPLREFKKARIAFFSTDADQWESGRADARAAAAS
ncbi:MAG: Lrp/AsnC family transcriptional regulator [Thermoanaerobaculia bacterium]